VAARTVLRVRIKGGTAKRYDLRPLLDDIAVADADAGAGVVGGPIVLRMRTRFDPELGSGRPEEIVAALAEATGSGAELRIGSLTRERLVLGEDAPPRRRR
jgi:hypothetical protein